MVVLVLVAEVEIELKILAAASVAGLDFRDGFLFWFMGIKIISM